SSDLSGKTAAGGTRAAGPPAARFPRFTPRATGSVLLPRPPPPDGRATRFHLHVVAAQVFPGFVQRSLVAVARAAEAEQQGERKHAQAPHGLPSAGSRVADTPPPYSPSLRMTQQ